MKTTLIALITTLLTACTPALATYADKILMEYDIQDSNNIPILAAEAGWTAQVQTVVNGESLVIDNPTAADAFLKDRAEEVVTEYIVRLYDRILRRQKDAEREVAKQAFKSTVEAGLTSSLE